MAGKRRRPPAPPLPRSAGAPLAQPPRRRRHPASARTTPLARLLAALLTLATTDTVASFTGDEFRTLSIRDSRGGGGVPRAAVLRGGDAPRQLVIGKTVNGEEVFMKYGGVVRIVMPPLYDGGSEFYCTGSMVMDNALLTAPSCFAAEYRPLTFANETDGKFADLPPYDVLAGDGRLVGRTTKHQYLYNPTLEGSRLSYVVLDTSERQIVVPPIPIYMSPLALPSEGFVVGYGPRQLTFVNNSEVSIESGLIRMGNLTVTDSSPGTRRIADRCTGARRGGDLQARRQSYMTDAEFMRLCPLYGDLGLPFFAPYNDSYALAGVFVDSDGGAGSLDGSCSILLNAFTSLPYQEAWIRRMMVRFSGLIDIFVICPSKTPSTTSTASYSNTPSLSASNSMNVTYMPPPVYEPYPWWWITIMTLSLLGTFGAGIYCCRTARTRVKVLSEGKPLSLRHVAKADASHFADTGDTADQDERKFIDKMLAIRHSEDPAKERAALGIKDEMDAALAMSKFRGEALRALGPDRHRVRLNVGQVQREVTKRKLRSKKKLDKLKDAEYDSDEIDTTTGRLKGRKRPPRPGVDLRNGYRLEDLANSRATLHGRFNGPQLQAEYSGASAPAAAPANPAEDAFLPKGVKPATGPALASLEDLGALSPTEAAAAAVASAVAGDTEFAVVQVGGVPGGSALSAQAKAARLLASASEAAITAAAARQAASSAAAAAAAAYNVGSYLAQSQTMDAPRSMPAGQVPVLAHDQQLAMAAYTAAYGAAYAEGGFMPAGGYADASYYDPSLYAGGGAGYDDDPAALEAAAVAAATGATAAAESAEAAAAAAVAAGYPPPLELGASAAPTAGLTPAGELNAAGVATLMMELAEADRARGAGPAVAAAAAAEAATSPASGRVAVAM